MVTAAQNTVMRLAASSDTARDPAPAVVVPVAFLGRTSTLELQDPRASLHRQARSAQAWLPPGFRIVAWYWDIESGGLDLETAARRRAGGRSTGSASPATAAWPTCSPKPPARPRHSPPWSARTSTAAHGTPSTR